MERNVLQALLRQLPPRQTHKSLGSWLSTFLEDQTNVQIWPYLLSAAECPAPPSGGSTEQISDGQSVLQSLWKEDRQAVLRARTRLAKQTCTILQILLSRFDKGRADIFRRLSEYLSPPAADLDMFFDRALAQCRMPERVSRSRRRGMW